MPRKIPLKKALGYILFSVAIVSLLPTLVVVGLRLRHKQKCHDPSLQITQLVQTGPVKEAVKSTHLEEMLGLSCDQPVFLYDFNLAHAKEKLLSYGIFKEVSLSLEPPNSLLVDYKMREPVAYLADYDNLVIDDNQVIFPLSPYYTPKILPKIYLGSRLDPLTYGARLEDEKLTVAFEILDFFSKIGAKSQKIHQVDVSKLRASTLGQQEIVVHLYEMLGKQNYERFLRLSISNYLEELEHYLNLKQMSMGADLVVDLRLLPNAYLTLVEEVKDQ